MRAPRELDELGDRRGMLVLAEVRPGDRGRDGVVVLADGNQQRPAVLAVEVHLRRPVWREVRQPVLEEDPPGLRYGVAGERGARRLLFPGVGERVVELLEVEVDDTVSLRRVR